MKLVIFGLSISSAWGNGHATLWRGLLRALVRRGHCPVFFEKDVPYYAANRDLWVIPGGELILYSDWKNIHRVAQNHLNDADVAITTSYCPDAIPATHLMLSSRVPLRVFYDLDTPVTLNAMRENGSAPYIGPNGLADYDLVLSYTGGRALQDLRTLLGARAVHTLYGSADPEVHHPVPYAENYRADMSYLGTFASDRQQILEQLFVESARQLPNYRFLIGGSQYPDQFPWTENIYYAGHVTPDQHPQFYCSARLNLSVTRGVMANMGFCPSGRLFEAAACGAPVLTDYWEGLETFFEPEREILIASTTEEAIDALQRPPDELRAIGSNARERVLASHTAEHRAIEFENALAQVSNTNMQPALGGI